MKRNSNTQTQSATSLPNRRSIRLERYDYSQFGAYFVSICTHKRACLFGRITDGKMILSAAGQIVAEEWLKTAEIRPNVRLDEWVVMPNHFHGILILKTDQDTPAGARRTVPETVRYAHLTPSQTKNTAPKIERFGKPVLGSIPTIVRSFKSAVTKRMNEKYTLPDKKLWQGGYYERVIRDDEEMNHTREYIAYNPLQWQLDKENPYPFAATPKPNKTP